MIIYVQISKAVRREKFALNWGEKNLLSLEVWKIEDKKKIFINLIWQNSKHDFSPKWSLKRKRKLHYSWGLSEYLT